LRRVRVELPDLPDDHNEEKQLIVKSGGGQIGGSVFGAGYRWYGGRFHKRGLESFDKPVEYGRHNHGRMGDPSVSETETGGSWSNEIDSGDYADAA
jgi:hypothetical protein